MSCMSCDDLHQISAYNIDWPIFVLPGIITLQSEDLNRVPDCPMHSPLLSLALEPQHCHLRACAM